MCFGIRCVEVEFRLLGPLQVTGGDSTFRIPAGKPRALLVLLALHPNEPLSTDRIVEALWDGRPPASAAGIVQTYVSRLRRLLGDDRIQTVGRGYALVVEEGERDLDAVERLRARARGEEPGQAAETLRTALALFRGRPLLDVVDEDFALVEVRRLSELHDALVAERIDADLALSRHADLVGELEALASYRPLDERVRGQLMLALYRFGRQSEALAAYQNIRRALAEIGLEPGEPLRALQRQILEHDPALAPPELAARDEPSAPSSVIARRRLPGAVLPVAAGLVLVLAAAASASLLAFGGDARKTRSVPVSANSVAVIDPERNTVVANIPVGNRPEHVAVGAGAVWVANVEDRTISRIDPATFSVTATVGLGFEPTGIAATAAHLWVAGGYDHALWRIDRDGLPRLKLNFSERIGPLPAGYERGEAGVAVGEGALWLVHGEEVTKLDPVSGAVRATARVGGRWNSSIAVANGAVWTALDRGGEYAVESVDARSPVRTGRVDLISFASEILAAAHSVWVAVRNADAVWQLDGDDRTLVRTLPVGDYPESLSFLDGSLWVSNGKDAVVRRLQPGTGEVEEIIPVGHILEGIAAGSRHLWVTVRGP
jgi:YVTN family beta-propeller protein